MNENSVYIIKNYFQNITRYILNEAQYKMINVYLLRYK